MRILAVDPGRDKCGVAVVDAGKVVARAVVSTRQLDDLIADWSSRYGVERILVGDRTGSKEIARIVESAVRGVPLTLVAETGTTLDARKRYFQDHPPAGWRRFIPLTLQVPSEPYDDYAAVILAERFIERMSTYIK